MEAPRIPIGLWAWLAWGGTDPCLQLFLENCSALLWPRLAVCGGGAAEGSFSHEAPPGEVLYLPVIRPER